MTPLGYNTFVIGILMMTMMIYLSIYLSIYLGDLFFLALSTALLGGQVMHRVSNKLNNDEADFGQDYEAHKPPD